MRLVVWTGRGAGLPDLQLQLDEFGQGLIRSRPIQAAQKYVGCLISYVVHVLGNAGESNKSTHLDIVLADEGIVIRDPESSFSDGLPCPDGLDITTGKDSRHGVVEGE